MYTFRSQSIAADVNPIEKVYVRKAWEITAQEHGCTRLFFR